MHCLGCIISYNIVDMPRRNACAFFNLLEVNLLEVMVEDYQTDEAGTCMTLTYGHVLMIVPHGYVLQNMLFGDAHCKAFHTYTYCYVCIYIFTYNRIIRNDMKYEIAIGLATGCTVVVRKNLRNSIGESPKMKPVGNAKPNM